MINTKIDLVNFINSSKVEGKTDKNKDVQKSKNDFNSVLKEATNTKEAKNTKEVNKVDEKPISKEVTKVTEVEKKFEELDIAIENGNDEEVIEVIAEILALLNINVIDNSNIPVVIDLNGNHSDLLIENQFSTEVNKEVVEFIDVDKTISLEGIEFAKNSELSNEEISILIKGLLDSATSEEVIDTFNKGLDNIGKLITDINGDAVSKETILTALNVAINSDVDTNSEDIKVDNIMLTEEVTVIDESKKVKEYSTELKDDSNESNANENNLDKDDKLLSKLIEGDSNNFNNAISKMEVRNSVGKADFTAPVTVYKTNMDNDVVKNVQFMVKNSISELKVKIYPKELGEMTIKILSEEGIMKAEIKAVSKETYELLNSNMNEIKKLLGSEEIKIQDVNIELYSEDTTYYSGEGYSDEKHGEQFLGKQNSKVESIVEELSENEISNDLGLDSLV